MYVDDKSLAEFLLAQREMIKKLTALISTLETEHYAPLSQIAGELGLPLRYVRHMYEAGQLTKRNGKLYCVEEVLAKANPSKFLKNDKGSSDSIPKPI
ncbi:MAG: hypothetical protein ACQGQO_08880 [Sphaerochaetaceae bacterium]